MTELEKKLHEALEKLEGIGRGMVREGKMFSQNKTLVLLKELIKEQNSHENSGSSAGTTR